DSQNVAYAIGTRLIKSIYPLLLPQRGYIAFGPPRVVVTPKLAIGYNNVNSEFLQARDIKEEGVYVHTVNPNSCFPTLQAKDFLLALAYKEEKTAAAAAVAVKLDNMGRVTVPGRGKVYLKEFLHIIPYGAVITATVIRDKTVLSIRGSFVTSTAYIVPFIYPL